MSVTIKIGDVDAESRSKLCFAGQKHGIEVIAAIQEDHRRQRVGADFMSLGLMVTEHLRHDCLAERFVGRKSSEHVRQGFPDLIPHPAGRHRLESGIILSLDQIDYSPAGELAEKEGRRMLWA